MDLERKDFGMASQNEDLKRRLFLEQATELIRSLAMDPGTNYQRSPVVDDTLKPYGFEFLTDIPPSLKECTAFDVNQGPNGPRYHTSARLDDEYDCEMLISIHEQEVKIDTIEVIHLKIT
jgi:hypothetical protein